LLNLEWSAEPLENRCLDAHRPIMVETVARIRPLKALRYAVDDLSAVVAPPYDVISSEQRSEYLARSPYSIVRLTLPDSEEHAARELADCRSAALPVEAREPAS